MSELDLDWDATTNEIVTFIRRIVTDARANGVVVGLSGGVDSSLVAKLSVIALGKNKVLGVLMPTEFTPVQDVEDAKELALMLGIETRSIPIERTVNSFIEAIASDRLSKPEKIPVANLRSRVRMVILFYFANSLNLLVAGTGDRSEDLIGYFTKYGDGGVDLLPISHLYKTQVRKLATHLGIPNKIAYKPSSPQLYPGHQATDEIPMDYDEMDEVLRLLFDEKVAVEEASRRTNVDRRIIDDVMWRYRSTAHKRAYPLMTRDW